MKTALGKSGRYSVVLVCSIGMVGPSEAKFVGIVPWGLSLALFSCQIRSKLSVSNHRMCSLHFYGFWFFVVQYGCTWAKEALVLWSTVERLFCSFDAPGQPVRT